jgi:hypothetical protein
MMEQRREEENGVRVRNVLARAASAPKINDPNGCVASRQTYLRPSPNVNSLGSRIAESL